MALVPIHDQRVFQLCSLLFQNLLEKDKFAVWTKNGCVFGIETKDELYDAVSGEKSPVVYVPHCKIHDDTDVICFPKGMFVAYNSREWADDDGVKMYHSLEDVVLELKRQHNEKQNVLD